MMRKDRPTYPETRKLYRWMYGLVMILVLLVSAFISMNIFFPHWLYQSETIITSSETNSDGDADKIENGIHVRTGLIDAEGLMVVVQNCTSCHSASLITQNRMTEERWNETIKWMQETQNLWELGPNQKVIVDYLVTNYPPMKKGRRMVLKDVDWYELED